MVAYVPKISSARDLDPTYRAGPSMLISDHVASVDQSEVSGAGATIYILLVYFVRR